MTKQLAVVFVIVGLSASPAIAGESYDSCMAFAEANALDQELCTCIAGNIGDDPELLSEQTALETLADVDAASSKLQEAINACVPS